MEKDLDANRISTETKRGVWIKKHEKFLEKSFSPRMHLLLLLVKVKGVVSNLRRLCVLLDVGYAQAFWYMELFKDLKFLVKRKKGRVNFYSMTKKGKNYCDNFLKKVM